MYGTSLWVPSRSHKSYSQPTSYVDETVGGTSKTGHIRIIHISPSIVLPTVSHRYLIDVNCSFDRLRDCNICWRLCTRCRNDQSHGQKRWTVLSGSKLFCSSGGTMGRSGVLQSLSYYGLSCIT